MELTFPRCHRLKSPRAISAIKRRPTSRRQWNGFRLAWRTDTGDDPTTRFAFVVSRHSGKAHLRNRIKRRLREAVRVNKSRWPAGASVVFTAVGSELAYQQFGELDSAIRQVFEWITQCQTKTNQANR